MKQLEVGFKDEYTDARAEKLEEKISRLGYPIDTVKIVDLYLLDGKLSKADAQKVKNEIFVDSVTQRGRFSSLYANFNWNWLVLVTFLPGVKDTVGERAKEAIEEHLGKPYEGKVFSGKKYLLKGTLEKDDVEKIAAEMANDIIQQVKIVKRKDFERNVFQVEPPKVESSQSPTVEQFDVASMTKEELRTLSEKRNLALSQDEMGTIKEYFRTPKVSEERQLVGLPPQMTDVELEVLAQTQSEHCKHKIFNAKIHYEDKRAEKTENIDSIFDTFIKTATEEIREGKDWILSVFWDNAGVVGFTDDFVTVMKFETHNSPSAKEPYGGAMTGIVGVYRDPMGTGKGCRIIAGSYGYCTASPFYRGDLQPEIAPRRLLEGIVEGVRDGGNKSGIPTIYGYSQYDTSFLGKPLVYVGAIGLMPREINGEASWKKDIEDGDFIVTVGGRVGKDGIHGVTQASQEFGESITSQHVQIGDPYKQKKVHDFLLEARDEGLYKFIWDVGGGGLSSAVGETARFSNGCELHLDRVPLKYSGLDPWEILLSESQERMLLGVEPEKFNDLKSLAEKHDVRVTHLGKYRGHGKFHVLWEGKTVAYLDMEFMHAGFPQLTLDAVWNPDLETEPTLPEVSCHASLLRNILSRINIASKEWIARQYDHEVQGTSVIKPYVGRGKDVESDAAVIRPIYDANEGLALALGNAFKYSQIDPYWMAASSLDEAIRRVLAVGASLDRICLNDNFCWPNPLYDPEENPDGKEKLGQLVRATKALYNFTKTFQTPCISGKDSMFIDGKVKDTQGNVHKVSGLPALQFAALGKVHNVEASTTLTPKRPGDLMYIVGKTKDELGASEYYEMQGKVGRNVPKVDGNVAYKIYRAISNAQEAGLLESCTGCYRGGLGVALAKKAMASELGAEVNLQQVPADLKRNDKLLYSESPSRFVITVQPKNAKELEKVLTKVPHAKIGRVTAGKNLTIYGLDGERIIDEPIRRLKTAYKATFRDF